MRYLNSTYRLILILSFIVTSCKNKQPSSDNGKHGSSDSLFLNHVPAQPGEETWKFVEIFKTPMWSKHGWTNGIPGKQFADLSHGVTIQTGCSHEVALVPYVPVPSLLYRKFRGMKNLGVTHAMLCWYFGNYPGLMNKGAGDLSFNPFPNDENSFLTDLASGFWKKEDVSKVVQAWKYFSEGYEHYPMINSFQWYGPMHDGPVWPLLNNADLFPDYTGVKPVGLIMKASPSIGKLEVEDKLNLNNHLLWQPFNYGTGISGIRWSATYDQNKLYLILVDSLSSGYPVSEPGISNVSVKLEPRRLWPCIHLNFDANTKSGNQAIGTIHCISLPGKQYYVIVIPVNKYQWPNELKHPVRMDVIVNKTDGTYVSWCENRPLPYRLVFGSDNPADLGWLLFLNKT